MYLGSGSLIKKAIKKYGVESFKKEILEKCFSIEELDEAERKWIKHFDAVNSDLFYNVHPGGNNRFDLHNSPNKEDILRRQRETRKQTMLDNPHIAKQAALKAKLTREKHPEKVDAMCKAILCYDLQGNFISKYKSIALASRELGIFHSGIFHCLKGANHRYKDYMFYYFTGDILQKIEAYKHPLEDKERSKELMNRIHSKNKGKKRTAEQCLKFSLIPKQKASAETKLKMSLSAKGKVRSKEHQEKLNKSQMIPVLHYDLNHNLVAEYSSLNDAALALGITTSTVCGHLKSELPIEKRKKFLLKYK